MEGSWSFLANPGRPASAASALFLDLSLRGSWLVRSSGGDDARNRDARRVGNSGGSVTQWLVSGELCIFADIARQYRHWALWTQARSCKCDGRERSQLLGVKLARGRVILGVISIV